MIGFGVCIAVTGLSHRLFSGSLLSLLSSLGSFLPDWLLQDSSRPLFSKITHSYSLECQGISSSSVLILYFKQDLIRSPLRTSLTQVAQSADRRSLPLDDSNEPLSQFRQDH